jgi:hypothetical protein
LYVIATITQIVFSVFEYSEIKYNGLSEYIKDSYNLMDASQPIFFFIHVSLRAYFGKIESFGNLKIFDNIVQIILILCSLAKVLQYIRFKE